MSEASVQLDTIDLYKIWAPDEGVWSPWVKPVPFAFWPRPPKTNPTPLRAEITPSVFPPASERRALVIDLPGGESVRCGAMLATLGYRPVPVFASCPIRVSAMGLKLCSVDVDEIITALAETASLLAKQTIQADATPAFLIDARRRAPGVSINDNFFDNRSAIFPSDFPSADFLARYGITGVTIVRDRKIEIAPDLGHALDHWHRAALPMSVIDYHGESIDLSWPASGFFALFLHNLRLTFSLKPNKNGGYGGFVTESSGG